MTDWVKQLLPFFFTNLHFLNLRLIYYLKQESQFGTEKKST